MRILTFTILTILLSPFTQGFCIVRIPQHPNQSIEQCHKQQKTEAQKKLLLNKRDHLTLINYLIKKNNYTSYLEIGIADGVNFRNVQAQHKLGVDPSPSAPATHQIPSDEFFQNNHETFDIIFIDGLHLSEQALKDVENSLNCLNPGGIIVMHDCKPEQIEHQSRIIPHGAWTGDVWKAAAYIRMYYNNVHFCVLDMDWGCGILTPNSSQTLYPAVPMEQLDWDFYLAHRKELLNIVSLDSWIQNN